MHDEEIRITVWLSLLTLAAIAAWVWAGCSWKNLANVLRGNGITLLKLEDFTFEVPGIGTITSSRTLDGKPGNSPLSDEFFILLGDLADAEFLASVEKAELKDGEPDLLRAMHALLGGEASTASQTLVGLSTHKESCVRSLAADLLAKVPT